MKKVVLATVAAVGFAVPSFAADMPAPAEFYAEAPLYDWSGFYVGVHAGFGTGEISFNTGSLVEDVDGFIAGGQIGYNFQNGNWVFGINSDLSWSDIHSDEAPGAGGADDTVNWLGTTTGRVGYAFDNVLLYAKAGVAYGEGTGYNGAANDEDSNTHIGWTAGAGAEVGLSDNWSVFVDYAYMDFGDENYVFPTIPAGVDAEIELHVVKAGVNFRF